jgi:predicted GTPase
MRRFTTPKKEDSKVEDEMFTSKYSKTKNGVKTD